MPRLTAIVAHWEKAPPASVSLAAIARAHGVGREPKRAAPAKGSKAETSNVRQLFEMLGANGFATEKPAWLAQVGTT